MIRLPRYLRNPAGGLAYQKGVTRADVDPEQLRMGIEVELEHTNDRVVAERIALDHLTERPDYYTALKRYVETGW